MKRCADALMSVGWLLLMMTMMMLMMMYDWILYEKLTCIECVALCHIKCPYTIYVALQ